MVKLSVINDQLKAAGCAVHFWGKAEVRELCHVLLPGETIFSAVNGQYGAGFAMLVATDFRVLLIDKKPKYLTLKDIRYDMITELDYANRLLDSTILIFTPNRELRFTAWNNAKLRKLFTHTQHKVMEIRNHFMMQQFQQQDLAKNTPPGLAMAMQRYGGGSGGQDYNLDGMSDQAAPPQQHFYQPAPVVPTPAPTAGHHLADESNDEQRKLAIAMGAAGLRSIVHNGKVIKDYMAVPFTQRWRKRPYGFSNKPVSRPT